MKKTILVVDDENGIRMLLKEMFSEKGYNVLNAETGTGALDMVEKNKIDLIIIDYKLPVMDGIKVLKEMEKNNKLIPAILISGMFENIHQDIKESRLIKGTLAKPFDIEELFNKVDTILN
ncbi:MAG TPA: response regulator [Candidatus Avamphibacillus sp.]|nr:response regulator [Candidatus Avamphibacillus sp.]